MDNRSSGGVSLDDAVVVVKGDASKRGDKKSDGRSIVENKINCIGRTLVLDNNSGSSFLGFSLCEKGDGISTSRNSNVGVGVVEPLDERTIEFYEGHN